MLGIFSAFSIFVLWLTALTLAFTRVHLASPHEILKYIWLILLIQFLYVGLFITIHDACHGTVAPGKPRFNLWLGRIFAFLYGGLSFDMLKKKHSQHHDFSGTTTDPDFHAPEKASFMAWITRFFKNYISLKQILLMCGVAQIFMHVLNIPEINVLAFWAAPSILSIFQLFYFGTYLPHRKSESGAFADQHRTRNFSISYAASWLSCYHFGAHHHTHHLYPAVPWFQLPVILFQNGIKSKVTSTSKKSVF